MSVDPDVQFLARELERLRRQVRSLGRASQAAFRAVELSDGSVEYYGEDGEVLGVIGKQEDGNFVPVSTGGTPPPTPTAPTVTPIEGGLLISYDGTFEDANWTDTVSHVEVHAWAPLLPGDPVADDTSQIFTFTSSNGGTCVFPVAEAVGTVGVAFQAVGVNGIEGPVSAVTAAIALPGTADRFPITETDIEDGAISTPKLAANAITGLVLTANIMQTDDEGERIVVRPDGDAGIIEFYPDDVTTPGYMDPSFEYDAPNDDTEAAVRIKPPGAGANFLHVGRNTTSTRQMYANTNITAGGKILAEGQPRLIRTRDVVQLMNNNAIEAVQWNTDLNTVGSWGYAAGEFDLPEDFAWYFVTASVSFASNPTGRRILRIELISPGGASAPSFGGQSVPGFQVVAQQTVDAVASAATAVNVCGLIPQYGSGAFTARRCRIAAFQNSGGPVDLTGYQVAAFPVFGWTP